MVTGAEQLPARRTELWVPPPSSLLSPACLWPSHRGPFQRISQDSVSSIGPGGCVSGLWGPTCRVGPGQTEAQGVTGFWGGAGAAGPGATLENEGLDPDPWLHKWGN